MELEFEKRGISYLQPLLQEVQNQEQTQELRLSDGMPDLGRVLGTWGQVILRSKEWRGDRVSISGGVMAFLLYVPEDGSEPRTMESWIPFQMKWDLPDGHHEGEIRIQCLLRFLDARVVSARKIMLRCGIASMGQAYRQETAMVSVPGEVPEDVQLRRNRYPLRIPKSAGEKTFQMEEELSLPPSAADIRKIVSYTLEPRVSECRMASGKLVFRGSAVLHLVYLGQEGTLESLDLEVPFSQLAEPEGELSQDARCELRMAVTALEVDPDPEGKLHLKAGLLAQYLMDDRETVELVEDAYSPDRDLTLKNGELEVPQILDQQRVNIPVRQTIRQEAEKIADVTYLPDFPVQRRGEGIQLELPGQFQVIWQDKDGVLQSSTARTEENWDMPGAEDIRVRATVLPGSAPSGGMGSGLELKGDMLLDVTSTSRRGLPMVTGLTLGEEKARAENRPSLILRRAGNAGLWNIAKSTGSTVAAIEAANALENEPVPDQILLIPVR